MPNSTPDNQSNTNVQVTSLSAPATQATSVSTVIPDGINSAQGLITKTEIQMIDYSLKTQGRLGKFLSNRVKFFQWGTNFADRSQSTEFQSASPGERTICAG